MNLDKSSLKNLITRSKPNDILVLLVDSLDKEDYKNYQNAIDKFVRKNEDYVITVIKK